MPQDPGSIDILARLLAFPTVSRDPNLELIGYARALLEARGVACTLVPDATGAKANLYATVGPGDRPGVMLSGHTDVVPVDGQDWTVPPFALTRRDGRLHGRGAADMKGFVACALRAALAAAGRPLRTPLHLALSHDEEVGCVGVRRLIEVLETAPVRPAFVIVGEPTGMAVATGHKGKLAARAVCTGREGHSALAPLALNAVHLACDFVAALRARQAELAASGARDGDYDVPYTTLHAGRIAGGVALNMVPGRCEVEFEIRNLAADDPGAILDGLRADAAAIAEAEQARVPEAGISIEIENAYPGLDTPPDAAVVAFVKSLTGANATVKVAFGTEGGLFAERLGIPAVVCGPGSMAQGHKPDEFVTEEQLGRCDAMLDALIGRLEAGL
jgi:acetylornithine deacetylase